LGGGNEKFFGKKKKKGEREGRGVSGRGTDLISGTSGERRKRPAKKTKKKRRRCYVKALLSIGRKEGWRPGRLNSARGGKGEKSKKAPKIAKSGTGGEGKEGGERKEEKGVFRKKEKKWGEVTDRRKEGGGNETVSRNPTAKGIEKGKGRKKERKKSKEEGNKPSQAEAAAFLYILGSKGGGEKKKKRRGRKGKKNPLRFLSSLAESSYKKGRGRGETAR